MNESIKDKQTSTSHSSSLIENKAGKLNCFLRGFIAQIVRTKRAHRNLNDAAVVIKEELSLLLVGVRVSCSLIRVHISDVLQNTGRQLVNLLCETILVASENNFTDYVAHFESLSCLDRIL